MVKFFMGQTDDERSGLLECLAQQQEAFSAVSYGLTDEQARAMPSAGSLSVGGLVKHVTVVQHGWTQRVLAAPGPWEQTSADSSDSFDFRPDESLDDLLGALAEQNAATRRAFEVADLATAVPVPGNAPWFPKGIGAWNVRWVALHLVGELARHAGHADIVRESIDGASMYELMAAMMGLPETDWLTPWKPAETR